MRILTLSNVFLDDAQGSGHVVLRYASEARRAGHTVEVMGPSEMLFRPGFPRAVRHRLAVAMAKEMLHRSATVDFDVLEIFGSEGWLAFLFAAGLHRRRRFLLVARSNGLEPHANEVLRHAGDPYRRRWFQVDSDALFARGLRAVDGIITVSQWDAEWGRRHLPVPGERVIAIENGLSDTFLRQEVAGPRDSTIVFCGAWTPIKGADQIASELVAVLRRAVHWRLVLVGVGAAFRTAEWFPEDLLSRVDAIPFLRREPDLRTLLRRSAILVAPSRYESFGLAVAEAMACGCAVVSTPVGFAAALRDDVEVLHATSNRGLGLAVDGLIWDPQLRERIARGGYLAVQRLRWERASESLLSTYEAWLATRPEFQRPATGFA